MQVTFPHLAARSRRMTDLHWNSGSPRACRGHRARAGPKCPRKRGNLSMSLRKSSTGTSAAWLFSLIFLPSTTPQFCCFYQSGNIKRQGICQCLHCIKAWLNLLLTLPPVYWVECRANGLGHRTGLNLTGKIFWGINRALWRARRVRRGFIFPPWGSNVFWGLGKKRKNFAERSCSKSGFGERRMNPRNVLISKPCWEEPGAQVWYKTRYIHSSVSMQTLKPGITSTLTFTQHSYFVTFLLHPLLSAHLCSPISTLLLCCYPSQVFLELVNWGMDIPKTIFKIKTLAEWIVTARFCKTDLSLHTIRLPFQAGITAV